MSLNISHFSSIFLCRVLCPCLCGSFSKFQIFLGEETSDTTLSDAFQEGAAQIKNFQDYITKASSMLTSEYFAIGQLILSEYVQSMKESLSEVIETIFSKLCGLLIETNEGICESFEEVKREALRKPKSSEELIEQGKRAILVIVLNMYF